ncbi:DNA-directed RNA polymerase subunit beta [Alkalihalobacterium chitinilyticum]|uniref:DNA-directed RNA polymerase subunit beta n=1 Tax=Alkalihalobacterium chitinilyticum TaxID=2980103 RepID=A0ABT5VJW2_9BACI|nr:DNA-directed RNA polymerase subunit beta [Alkalihalobacterium chitinilyticum]MDE5414733.1 DNA-directed RNA polymerase subunit beta [Alkalihalobacterium chitinilyticum]
MENRDLEKDKLNTDKEQDRNEATTTSEPETTTRVDGDGGAVQRPAPETGSKDEVEGETKVYEADVLAASERSSDEAEETKVFSGADQSPAEKSTEDAVDGGENKEETEEASDTKVYSSAGPSDPSSEAEGTVDLSQDTIVTKGPLTRAAVQSRSGEVAVQADANEEEKAGATTDEEEKDTREKRNKKKRKKRERIRLIPIWLRIVIVILLCGLSLVAGLMFGYGVVGNGTPTDILQRETWEHIVNIISGAE